MCIWFLKRLKRSSKDPLKWKLIFIKQGVSNHIKIPVHGLMKSVTDSICNNSSNYCLSKDCKNFSQFKQLICKCQNFSLQPPFLMFMKEFCFVVSLTLCAQYINCSTFVQLLKTHQPCLLGLRNENYLIVG